MSWDQCDSIVLGDVQLVQLFKSYFGGTFSETAIKNNFVLIYELLDETIDFGYPQITDPAIMKSFIFQKGVKTDVETVSTGNCSAVVVHRMGMRFCRPYVQSS